MSRDRSEEIARRTADVRFRAERLALSQELQRLLGELAPPALSDRAHAASIKAEFWASLHAAESTDWAFLAQEWAGDSREAISTLLHRLKEILGPRPVWLTIGTREPQAFELNSDFALDNPFGFATLCDSELRLLDREATAGLWLGRHSHHGASSTTYTWELNVWGEPWLSAGTRAIREAAG